MGSLKFDGVRFQVYSDDHGPPHVHAFGYGLAVIIEIVNRSKAKLADRPDAVKPQNAKRSDVRKVVRCASEHAGLLMELWETIHETTSE